MKRQSDAELTALQVWMERHLQSRRALSKLNGLPEAAKQHLSSDHRLSPIEQLEIYRCQFWLRHTAALVEDFPGLSGILGQSEWERLVESYLEAFPPNSFSLRDLGHAMPAHVERQAELPHHGLCIDMARLEWAYVELFDAEESGVLSGEKLQSLTPEDWLGARLIFNPAWQLLHVNYPVAALRRHLREASESAEAPPNVAIPGPAPQHLVLYRASNKSLFHRVVAAGAYRLLHELHAGTSLGQACEQVASRHPELASEIEGNVASWFQEWGQKGWIVDVQVAS